MVIESHFGIPLYNKILDIRLAIAIHVSLEIYLIFTDVENIYYQGSHLI